MKIGIYSGSFNPVHQGHVALCDYLVKEGMVDEVWLIRSPLNPLKAQSADSLAPDADRQRMLELAIKGHLGLKVCCIEDTLSRPNYSINTLRVLQQIFPEDEFHLIIGADNWLIFDHWKAYDEILSDFHLIVYPRPGYDDPSRADICEVLDTNHVRFASNAPLFNISSTQIREAVAHGERPEMLDDCVLDYIRKNDLYRLVDRNGEC